MYDSFDTLPILNWHNFLKSGDYASLLIDKSKKYNNKQLTACYEKLIDSTGNKKLLNGYYAKCLQSSLINSFEKTPKSEQKANNDFFDYLRLLNESIDYAEINNKRFNDVNEAYNYYYSLNGHKQALEKRVIDFHYNNFPDKIYDFDLFKDIAILENYLKRPIDPAKISVNHYNAIKEQANKKAQREKFKK